MKELKLENFHKLKADVAITRNANSLLSSHLIDREKQCWANTQYSRREILEIVRLPKSLTNEETEAKVCQIIQSLDCNVNKEHLDACNQLEARNELL